jgi:putative transcriptional regulator
MRTRIAELRKQLGLTQEELAKNVDVSRQTILVLEQGRYNPSLRLASDIARALKQKHVEDVFDL